jgi:hypothetical protein
MYGGSQCDRVVIIAELRFGMHWLTSSRGEQELHGPKTEDIFLHRIQSDDGQFETHFEQEEHDSQLTCSVQIL